MMRFFESVSLAAALFAPTALLSEEPPAQRTCQNPRFLGDPAWTRKGITSRIMQGCATDASVFGLSRLELVATLTGDALYRAHRFSVTERFNLLLPNGTTHPVVGMSRSARN